MIRECAVLLALFVAACTTNEAPPSNPLPSLYAVTPPIVAQGESVTVTLHGADFTRFSRARWNGNDVPTTFLTDSTLAVHADSALTSIAELTPIQVVTPPPGGGSSGFVAVSVTAFINMTISNIAPLMAVQNGAAFTLNVYGTFFTNTSVIQWNGANRPTTFVDAGHLTASVSSADLASTGPVAITVVKGAQTAGPLPFAIVSSAAGHPHAWGIHRLAVGNGPWGVGIAPSGAAFVTQPLTDSVARIDLVTPKVLGGFAVGHRPDDIVGAPNGTTAYVTNINDNAVGVVDLSSFTQTAAFPATQPLRVRVSNDGAKLYVTTTTDSLVVMSATSGTILKELSLGGGAGNGMAMMPDGAHLWVSATNGTVYEINTAADTIARTVGGGGTLQDAVLSSDGATLYVADESGAVRVYSTATATLTATIPVASAFGLALTPDNSELWVTQSANSSLTVIDVPSRGVLGFIPALGAPRHLGITGSGSTVLVADESGHALVIN